LLMVTALTLAALFVFSLKYITNRGNFPLPLIFDGDKDVNYFLYKLNFFTSMGVFISSLLACIFFTNFFSRMFSVIFGFASCIIGVYALNDIFSINLCLYIAYIIAVSLSFTPLRGLIISSSSIFLFVYFLYRPKFMGLFPADYPYIRPDITIITPLSGVLIFAMISTIIIRELFDKYRSSQKTVEYLKKAEQQLALFNTRLQRQVSKRSEKMVKNERLKLSRDLHDTCGYAFTNIILLSDAAVSHNEMDLDDTQELFQKIRNLASKGLQETREILHFIRRIQTLYIDTTDTILQIKSIFEDTTGIEVEVLWGNIRNYAPRVNRVITRIIQEAFTNSIRHGQASYIQINLFESDGKLFLSITDNGKGSRQIIKGIGFTGMEERLKTVDGGLTVSTPPEGGFRLIVTIPVHGWKNL